MAKSTMAGKNELAKKTKMIKLRTLNLNPKNV